MLRFEEETSGNGSSDGDPGSAGHRGRHPPAPCGSQSGRRGCQEVHGRPVGELTAGGASARGRGEGPGGTPVLTLPLAGCVTQAREPTLWASSVASSTWPLPLLENVTVCDSALGLGCVCSWHAGGSGGHSPCFILLHTAPRWVREGRGALRAPLPQAESRAPPRLWGRAGRGLWPGQRGRVAAGDLPGGLRSDVQEHRLLHGGPSAPAGE